MEFQEGIELIQLFLKLLLGSCVFLIILGAIVFGWQGYSRVNDNWEKPKKKKKQEEEEIPHNLW